MVSKQMLSGSAHSHYQHRGRQDDRSHAPMANAQSSLREDCGDSLVCIAEVENMGKGMHALLYMIIYDL
jgi:hypothetical protein